MTTYSKEVLGRIRELEAEIESLKQNNIVIPGRKDMEGLSKLTDVYAGDWNTRISWLARMSVCGAVRDSGRNCRAKKLSELSAEEADGVANCTKEVMEVLLKYARQIKQEEENE